MIIDAHVHCFERILGLIGRGEVRSIGAGKAKLGTGEELQLMPPSFVSTSFAGEVLIEYMDLADVDKAVLLQGNFYGFHNEYLASLMNLWPDRLLGCALVDPALQKGVDILRYAMEELGLKGLKLELSEFYGLLGLHPDLRLNDPRLGEFWSSFARYRLPLVLDLGPIGEKGYQLDELEEVLSVHPGIRNVVICHLGSVSHRVETSEEIRCLWWKFMRMAQQRDFYLDLASLSSLFDENQPYPISQKYIKIAFETLGSERLLWGSDLPGTLSKLPYHQGIDMVKEQCTFLSFEEKDRILGENALRVFDFSI